MSISVGTKVQIGFSLGAISVMTIGTVELLMHWEAFGSRAEIVCGGLGGIGVLMWLTGQRSDSSASNSMDWFAAPKYWGLVLAFSVVLAYSYHSYRQHQNRPRAAAPHAVSQAVPQPEVKVVFPSLRLQGIVYHGAKSSALISGKVVYVGDDIAQAQVVSIGPDHVALVMQGQTNVLRFSNSQAK